jgi:polyribonucleotide nucleotidyltransferase
MGIEDFSGEMDFKVAGTATGITAIQLDVKNVGLTDRMISETLDRARVARLQILEVMQSAIGMPRPQVSAYAPKIVVVPVPEEKVGEIIGPGGKMIRQLTKTFGVTIDVEDDAKVVITGVDGVKVNECAKHIANMTRDLVPGEKFMGKVTRVESYGAFVEVIAGKQGLIHVSRLAQGYVRDAGDVVHVGDEFEVEVYEIDEMGRINIKPTIPFQVASTPHDQPGGGGEEYHSYGDRRGGGHGGGYGGRRHGGDRFDRGGGSGRRFGGRPHRD